MSFNHSLFFFFNKSSEFCCWLCNITLFAYFIYACYLMIFDCCVWLAWEGVSVYRFWSWLLSINLFSDLICFILCSVCASFVVSVWCHFVFKNCSPYLVSLIQVVSPPRTPTPPPQCSAYFVPCLFYGSRVCLFSRKTCISYAAGIYAEMCVLYIMTACETLSFVF